MAPHGHPHGPPWAPLRFFSFGLRFFFRLSASGSFVGFWLPVLISVGCFCGFQVMLSRETCMEDMLLLRPPPRDLLEAGPPPRVKCALERFEERIAASVQAATDLADRFGIRLPD